MFHCCDTTVGAFKIRDYEVHLRELRYYFLIYTHA